MVLAVHRGAISLQPPLSVLGLIGRRCSFTLNHVPFTTVNVAPIRRALKAAWCVCLLGGCATASPEPPQTAAAPQSHDMHDMQGMHDMHHGQGSASMASGQAMNHQGHDMSGMGGAEIVIPPGAIYTEADVSFMQGMIAHHAQAIYMSRMAPSRDADPRLTRLAQKIDLSQEGEIVLMQDWLRANGQFVPDTSSWRTMTMHGMLTTEELAKLEAARGQEFDRLYLQYMIRHHEGALVMVADLYASPRAAQDVDISVLANDIETTQRAEIGLMQAMLTEL